MKNVSIKFRIMTIAIVALTGLVISSGYVVLDKKSTVTSMSQLNEMAMLAPAISGVVHELQKERGTSAVYIGSKGSTFADVLPQQRDDTDSSINALSQHLKSIDHGKFGGAFEHKVSTALDDLKNRASVRGSVWALNSTTPQMAAYYTGTISNLLDVVEQMSQLSDDADVTRSIIAYTNFLQLKERAGIERAVGAGGFAAKAFPPVNYRKFVSLLAEQEGLRTAFVAFSSPDQSRFLNQTVDGAVIDDVSRMRKIILDSVETGNTGGIDGAYWFGQKTREIDLMKRVEDRVAGDLLAQSEGIRADAARFLTITIALSLAAMALAGGLSIVIIRGIVGPVGSITKTMVHLSEGEYKIEVPETDRGDEIGSMANALLVFQSGLIEAQRLQAVQSEAQEVELNRAEAIGLLTDTFHEDSSRVLGIVASATEEMQVTAASLTSTAEETASQAEVVTEGADGASQNVRNVAAASEQLRASISEIAEQVEHSTAIAREAADGAELSSKTMGTLSESAQGITNVVDLIQDIASQTNLLALNATIEAARAGEAGKGFAVVASEVKSLAQQTAQATEQIAEQIEAMQSVTGDAVTSIESIAATIRRVNEISASVASAVTEQSAATDEIARGVEEAARGTQGVTENVAAVSQAAGDTSSAAVQVSSAASELAGQTEELKFRIEGFLTAIKAA